MKKILGLFLAFVFLIAFMVFLFMGFAKVGPHMMEAMRVGWKILLAALVSGLGFFGGLFWAMNDKEKEDI